MTTFARAERVPATPIGAFDRPQFEELCRAIARGHARQGEDYRRYHADRFWETYRTATRLLKPGATIASVGAGAAYVEAALVASIGARCVVFDFAQAVETDATYYASVGLEPVAVDLTDGDALEGHAGHGFDLVLSCEIVEHLPSPPAEHFRQLAPLIAPTGALLVTTPNAGSIRRVLKTLLHRPVLPPAERTFGPVNFDNEDIHRREYMASEIIAALAAAGLGCRRVDYLVYGRSRGVDKAFYPLEVAVPWFRDVMNIIATPEARPAPP